MSGKKCLSVQVRFSKRGKSREVRLQERIDRIAKEAREREAAGVNVIYDFRRSYRWASGLRAVKVG